jgi:MerR family transcriptional regulator, light-induced transcriptional regulator
MEHRQLCIGTHTVNLKQAPHSSSSTVVVSDTPSLTSQNFYFRQRMKEETKLITIQELAQIVGVSTSALRAWERRYSIFSPQRTRGGHRLYGQEDVKLFWYISHLRSQGNDLKQIANSGREALLKSATEFFNLSMPAKNFESAESVIHEKRELPSPFRKILDALKNDEIEEAIRSLEQIFTVSANALQFADSALDLMVEVGESWHRGELTVVAEHALTSRLKHMLLGLFYLTPTDSSQSESIPLALCATLPHELHELGLMRVAIYLKHWGYSVGYLGANTPISDIEEFCVRRRPHVVVVSCASSLNMTSMVHSLQKLAVLVTPYAPVVVGGSGITALQNAPPEFENLIFLKKISDLELIAKEAKKVSQQPPIERVRLLKAMLS